jgi:hypothetical protein
VYRNLTEQEAFLKEKELIKLYKMFGYCESNLTDGGEGALNPSQEVREKISKTHKGKTLSKEHLNMLRNYRGERHHNFGKSPSEGSKRKNSQSHIGKVASVETKKKLSESRMGPKNHNFGKIMSEELRMKNSKGHIGQKAWNRGISMSEEARKKLSQKNRGQVPPNIKEVIDMNTGIVWSSIKEVSVIYGINYSTLKSYLQGRHKNRTPFRLVKDVN